MLRREANLVIVRLLREIAVAAFIHQTRVPRVLYPLLNNELHKEVEGIVPVRPQQVQRSFRGFRIPVEGRDA